ncbi:MAG: lytic transglycosylase domain-containing protein [Rhodoferax sp.]
MYLANFRRLNAPTRSVGDAIFIARNAQWIRAAAFFYSLCCLSAVTQPVLAQTSRAVLDDAPPAVRAVLQQASDIESAPATPDAAWRAAGLYCQAARWGSAEGQYRLGMLYAFGQGVPASRAYAAALFSVAAGLGHAQAQQMLETIELGSAELPACASLEQEPEKAAITPPLFNGIDLKLSGNSSPGIDQYLLKLPASRRWIVPVATTLSLWYALDPKLVLSVIAAESNFQTEVQSPKAATGLMQLIADTAERFNVRNAFDATQNMRGGIRYLRWLLSYYRGHLPYVLAAYNAGEGRVDQYQGVPPFPETRAYVQRVVGLYGGVEHKFDATLTTAPAWLAGQLR